MTVMVLTQVVRPGSPVIYGGFTSNVDMRTGSPGFKPAAWASSTTTSVCPKKAWIRPADSPAITMRINAVTPKAPSKGRFLFLMTDIALRCSSVRVR